MKSRQTMDETRIRRLTKDDLHNLDRFHRECFGRPLSSERWRWFNCRAPTGPTRAYIAEAPATGRILATYSLLPLQLLVNGEPIPASLAVNAAVHPTVRRQGWFVRMGGYALEHEIEFNTRITIGKPNVSALPGHRRLDWTELCPLPLLSKPAPMPQSHHCRSVDSFDDRFDAFFEKISNRFSFIILKDIRYMKWRFHPPDRTYTSYIVESGYDLQGYIIVKDFAGPKGRVVHIMDLQAADTTVLGELIAAAENHAAGAREINLWSNPHDPYAPMLLERGYSIFPRNDRLIIHTNAGEPILPKPGAWWFAYGDNDIH